MRNTFLKAVFVLAFGSPSALAGGTDIFYGGDPIISAFQEYQQKTLAELKNIPVALLPEVTFLQKYQQKISETRIGVSSVRLFKDGFEYLFLNYPHTTPPQIVISRDLWNQKTLTEEEYKKLALHEMLHLLGYDDSKYVYSNRLGVLSKFFRQTMTITFLIQSTLYSPSDDLRPALVWTLTNFPDVVSPLSPQFSDEDLASLVAFCGRSPFLDELPKNVRNEIISSLTNFLTLYTFASVPFGNETTANAYECTLRELDKYKGVILPFVDSYQDLIQRGYRFDSTISPTRICHLLL